MCITYLFLNTTHLFVAVLPAVFATAEVPFPVVSLAYEV
jgi:hypothetical protein